MNYSETIKNFHSSLITSEIKEITIDKIPTPSDDGTDNKYWTLLVNKDDGHCFYHTILRYLNEKEHSLSWVVPQDYNPKRQRSKDVSILRGLLINSNKLFQSDDFFLEALNQSMNNKKTDNWAGMSDMLGQFEFIAMAELLNICLVIWQEDDFSGGWTWRVFNPPSTIMDQEILLNREEFCPHVLYIHNTDGNHFNTLLPNTKSESSGGKKNINLKLIKKSKFTKKRKNKY